MRPLRVAFAACVLFAAPTALLAQSAQQPVAAIGAQHPVVKPIPGIRPRPTQPRPNNRRRPAFPIIIDSSVVDRFLPPPQPAPQYKRAPRLTKSGEDVFETHSTEDNAR